MVLVLGAVGTMLFAALSVAGFLAGYDDPVEPVPVTLFRWDLLIGATRPPTGLILSALFAMLGIATAAVTLEAFAAIRIARSPDRVPLPEQMAPRARDFHPSGKVRVTVLVPAHNEEASIGATLQALALQSRPPERVIVVADNCTDRTAAIATEHGAEVFATVDNVHKKGGALNQALSGLLPTMGFQDVVLVMDADTRLNPDYLLTATRLLDGDPDLDAVGGVFFGEPGHGWIGQFQRNEYMRYSGQIRRRRGRVFVLTGTASVFRATALAEVAAARGVTIPGEHGAVYDTAALTEDNELTIALKSVGSAMVSPDGCAVETELMPTWGNLWRQRLRWQRGALENISAYGVTTATSRYWGQQVGIAYGTVALNSSLLLLLITLLAVDQWVWFPFWLVLGFIFWLERVLTVWRGGWRARGLAALLFAEIGYDVFLQCVFVRSLWDISLRRRAAWGHVQHGAVPAGGDE